MLYSVPPRFAHGGTNVSAANFNIFSDDLNALFVSLVSFHPAIGKAELPPTPAVLVKPVVFVNVWRWLWYQSITGETATIEDPSGVGASVNLPDSDSAMVVYDLANVAWLTQGMVYQVIGCQFSGEDFEA